MKKKEANKIKDGRVIVVSPKLKRIIGAVKLPPGFDEKKELSAYLEKKHL